jgi:aryl-alcohol dehydrogenase-like predicted oxidoreductase
MDYRWLGATGVRVSALCLGTSTFGPGGQGGGTTYEEAKDLVEGALELGVNLFDTADIYSGGECESYLGRILAGKRDDVLISTKAGIPAGPGPNRVGSTRVHVLRQLEGSLRRLNTDHVDIFYLHFQDDHTDLDDQVQLLGELVTSGKVRYAGLSNHSAGKVALAAGAADRLGCPGVAAYQGFWNLLARDVEDELLPLCRERRLGFLAWGPLAGGLLTGKYGPGRPRPEQARLAEPGSAYFGIDEEKVDGVLAELERLAGEHGATVAQVSLAWLLAQPGLTSVVVGARNREQLAENVGAVGVALADEELRLLDELAPRRPHWPQWHQAWRSAWRLGL